MVAVANANARPPARPSKTQSRPASSSTRRHSRRRNLRALRRRQATASQRRPLRRAQGPALQMRPCCGAHALRDRRPRLPWSRRHGGRGRRPGRPMAAGDARHRAVV